jgi:hypothetical protein
MILFLAAAVPVTWANGVTSPTSNFTPGVPPVIDGSVGSTEWQGASAMHLTPPDYPIETYVYFLNDNFYQYVLVDAVGDPNENLQDECLMVFGLPPDYHPVEIYYVAPNLMQVPGTEPDSLLVTTARGFGTSPADTVTPHRIYEFRIDFDYLGILPGESTAFYSPASIKSGYIPYASMPFDAADSRDNVYPVGLVVSTTGSPAQITAITSGTPATLTTAQANAIPTLQEWGMICLASILGLSAMARLSRGRTAV